jgi:hypothetical protein
VREVDLGPCKGALHEGDPARCVVLLPGARYSTRHPLLWFAREVAGAGGWSALEVLDEPGAGEDPFAWARDRAERALAGTSAETVVVVGKSLTSAAAGLVAERELPAVWLTPLLRHAAVVEGLAATRRPCLLVGGSADEHWHPAAIPDNPLLEVVELAGLDHSLQAQGDVLASLDALRDVSLAISEFLGRV